MLENTFMHLQGIGTVTEQRLWEAGIRHWDQFNGNPAGPLSAGKAAMVAAGLDESRRQLSAGNPNYFAKHLPASQHWRLFPHFRHTLAYLDIETTGLESWGGRITTIALYDGSCVRHYVNGRNLDDFPADIRKYRVISTYNGKSFDVPFIQDFFGITLNQAHIDLRYVLSSLGFRGGLKSCERQLGMDRGEMSAMDGWFAVLLWEEYEKTGRPETLETLLAYNVQDVLSLESLMVTAYNRKIRHTPFFAARLPEPRTPKNPFNADPGTIDRIKTQARSAWIDWPMH